MAFVYVQTLLHYTASYTETYTTSTGWYGSNECDTKPLPGIESSYTMRYTSLYSTSENHTTAEAYGSWTSRPDILLMVSPGSESRQVQRRRLGPIGHIGLLLNDSARGE